MAVKLRSLRPAMLRNNLTNCTNAAANLAIHSPHRPNRLSSTEPFQHRETKTPKRSTHRARSEKLPCLDNFGNVTEVASHVRRSLTVPFHSWAPRSNASASRGGARAPQRAVRHVSSAPWMPLSSLEGTLECCRMCATPWTPQTIPSLAPCGAFHVPPHTASHGCHAGNCFKRDFLPWTRIREEENISQDIKPPPVNLSRAQRCSEKKRCISASPCLLTTCTVVNIVPHSFFVIQPVCVRTVRAGAEACGTSTQSPNDLTRAPHCPRPRPAKTQIWARVSNAPTCLSGRDGVSRHF